MESSKSYQCKKIKISQIHANPNNLHDIPKRSWEAEKSFQLSLIEKVIKKVLARNVMKVLQNHVERLLQYCANFCLFVMFILTF